MNTDVVLANCGHNDSTVGLPSSTFVDLTYVKCNICGQIEMIELNIVRNTVEALTNAVRTLRQQHVSLTEIGRIVGEAATRYDHDYRG
jgi:hypothetical protein